jgi:FeS assembly protein IscX
MALTWDDAYEIAVYLMGTHPGVNPSTIDPETLHVWIRDLPGFAETVQEAPGRKLETIRTIWLALAESGGAAGPPAM